MRNAKERKTEKWRLLLAGLMLGVLMSGCGEKEEREIEKIPQVEQEADQNQETDENQEAEQETAKNPDEEEEQVSVAGDAQTEVGKEENEQPEEAAENKVYEDNFAVENEVVAAYGKRIKEAVAAKNLEALADLTSFPTYVGFVDNGVVVDTREDFLALGADKIFTQEMVNSVAAADESNLSPSMAGFLLCGKDDMPSIIYGIVEGRLAIKGINY